MGRVKSGSEFYLKSYLNEINSIYQFINVIHMTSINVVYNSIFTARIILILKTPLKHPKMILQVNDRMRFIR